MRAPTSGAAYTRGQRARSRSADRKGQRRRDERAEAERGPGWKYVNVRRYFAFLEHSIDKGTQFAVNGRTIFLRWTVNDCEFPLTGYAPCDTNAGRLKFLLCMVGEASKVTRKLKGRFPQDYPLSVVEDTFSALSKKQTQYAAQARAQLQRRPTGQSAQVR
jgi:hypothetical protein